MKAYIKGTEAGIHKILVQDGKIIYSIFTGILRDKEPSLPGGKLEWGFLSNNGFKQIRSESEVKYLREKMKQERRAFLCGNG